MQLSPTIAIHMTAALGALALGPVVLWARRAGTPRVWVHRAAGYAWVTLMLLATLSAAFIREHQLPNVAGFSPIHLFIPVVLWGLVRAFTALARRDIATHRKAMRQLYFGACIGAGAFALAPGRYLGQLLWGA